MILMPIFLIRNVLALKCKKDSDCRIGQLIDFTSRFCSEGVCRELREGGSPCTHPTQCASYLYYGPAACSATCSVSNHCKGSIYSDAAFCCKTVPNNGLCNSARPGGLSGCSEFHKCIGNGKKAKCSVKSNKTWGAGVVFCIIGNLLINAGVNVQKLSYSRSTLTFMNYHIGTMIVGTFIYGIGKFIAFSAYLFGSQSMLAGLSGIGLISNSALAPLINHEQFTWRDALAIACVLAGTGTMLLNTSKSNKVLTSCELFRMYFKMHAILWLGFIILMIAVIYLGIRFVEVNSDWHFPNDNRHFLRSGLFFPETGFVCKFVLVIPYVCLSALIASFSSLSAKSLGEVLKESYRSRGVSQYLLVILFTTLLVFFTFWQIYWLNRALRHYDALLTVPLFHITWTILSITTAGIYFQDFDNYTFQQFKLFLLSIFVVFCGSAFLAIRVIEQNRVRGQEIQGRNLHLDRRR